MPYHSPSDSSTPNPDKYSQERASAVKKQIPLNAVLHHQLEHKDVRILASPLIHSFRLYFLERILRLWSMPDTENTEGNLIN